MKQNTVDGNDIPNNSSSFNYKSNLITNRNGVKIAVPLKYFSNFWRSLEMSFINCEVELSLSWDPSCVQSNLVGASTCKITDAKLYVPIVNFRFYWNKYKINPNQTYNENDYIRELLDASYQGVKRLFVLAYRDFGGANRVTADSHRRYFLPRIKIKNYNIEIDGRNFYGQTINDLIKQYDEVRKVSTGQGDDYTTGFFIGFCLFQKQLQTNCFWFKQTNLRAIEQINFPVHSIKRNNATVL